MNPNLPPQQNRPQYPNPAQQHRPPGPGFNPNVHPQQHPSPNYNRFPAPGQRPPPPHMMRPMHPNPQGGQLPPRPQANQPPAQMHPQQMSSPPYNNPNIQPLTDQMNSMDINQGGSVKSSKIRARHAYDQSLTGSYEQSGQTNGAPNPYQPIPNPNYGQQYPHAQAQAQPQAPQPYAPIPPNAQQRPKIDPEQAPSIVAVQAANQEEYDKQPFATSSRTVPPLSSTQFIGYDEGNCNPKFARATINNIPVSADLMDSVQIPLGVVFQPLAKLRPDEYPIQVVDCGEAGPLRCSRCKGYINPLVQFIMGGRKYICNLCKFENDVPESYFCNLDVNGRRLDVDYRPELRYGSVEFVATKEYCLRDPVPASYVFAIDVSFNSIQSGFFRQVVQSIKNLLYSETQPFPNVKIGLITYDRTVHFYNFNPYLEQAQMMVVADINETFVPLSDGFLVDPHESRNVIEPFLDGLVDMFANNRVAEATLGAAIECAQLALKDRGGKVIAFHTCLPTLGPGTLKNRDNMKQLGTEKEKQLFVPQDPFYEKLAQTCVDNGVSVDLFLAPHHMVDLTTIGLLSSISGGETYFYPGFEISKDGNKLNGDLSELLSLPFGFNGVMRVRCSDGLVIDEHIGNFYNRNSSDLELGGIDSEKSITVLFKHESKLDEKSEASFQCALLYTTQEGQRRIRVHNLSIPVTTLIGNAFKYADMDTIVSVLIKLSIANSAESHLKLVRDQFTEQCVKILTGYRKNCAQGTAPGQLILPEALKLLPLLANGALKLKALRSGLDVTLDSRVYYMRLLKGLSVASTIRLLYPNVYELHNMPLEVGEPNHNGRIALPKSVRASYTNLDPSGAYLLENGDQSFIWLGRQVKSEFLQAAFGASSLEQIDTKITGLPVVSSNVNEQIRKVIDAIQTQRSRSVSSVQIVRQQLDQRELEFCNLLIEDKNLDNMSYIDYLCHIHRQIQIEVSRT